MRPHLVSGCCWQRGLALELPSNELVRPQLFPCLSLTSVQVGRALGGNSSSLLLGSLGEKSFSETGHCQERVALVVWPCLRVCSCSFFFFIRLTANRSPLFSFKIFCWLFNIVSLGGEFCQEAYLWRQAASFCQEVQRNNHHPRFPGVLSDP